MVRSLEPERKASRTIGRDKKLVVKYVSSFETILLRQNLLRMTRCLDFTSYKKRSPYVQNRKGVSSW